MSRSGYAAWPCVACPLSANFRLHKWRSNLQPTIEHDTGGGSSGDGDHRHRFEKALHS